MADTTVICTALYDDVSLALSDLDVLERLNRQARRGVYDAAVVDNENGRPHVVMRAEHPEIRVIPEVFGSGALPREELHEAARELTWQAGLIAVGGPGFDEAFDQAVRTANRVNKRSVDLPPEELPGEIAHAFTPGR